MPSLCFYTLPSPIFGSSPPMNSNEKAENQSFMQILAMEKKTSSTSSSSATLKNKFLGLFRSSSACNLTSSKALSVQDPVFLSSRRHDHLLSGGKGSPAFSEPTMISRWFREQEKTKEQRRRGKKYKKKSKNTILLQKNPYGFTSSASSSDGGEPTDNDNEYESETDTHTLFSSRSLSFSSDSSEFYYSSGRRRKVVRRRPPRRRGSSKRHDLSGGFRPLVSVSSPGLPVVKDSDDPYADFRASMVEMIVEKQIFGKEELEGLLRCYLSLNSSSHRSTILKVFSDICEVLFCN